MPKTLLAVDDSATMRKVLEITFGGDDFQVVTAENRDKALAQLGGKPAVVLIDAALGAGDEGYALSKEIRAKDSATTIILLSSRHAPYDAAKGKDAGADDFMDKPFDTAQAIEKVKKAVAARAGGGSAQAAAPAAAPPAAAPAPAPAPAPAAAAKPAPAPAAAAAPAAKPAVAAGPFGAPAAAAPAQKSRSATLMFGGEVNASKSPGAGPVAPVIPGGNAPPAAAARPVQKPAPELVATAQSASHAPAQPAAGGGGGGHVSAAVNGQLGAKLGELGLSKDQAEAVMALSREVVERVVWEVVPHLAEVMIREELARLTKD